MNTKHNYQTPQVELIELEIIDSVMLNSGFEVRDDIIIQDGQAGRSRRRLWGNEEQ